MKSILVILQSTAKSPIARLALGAVESEAARRNLTVTVITDERNPAAILRGQSVQPDAVIVATAHKPEAAEFGLPSSTVSLAHLSRETAQVFNQLVPETAAIGAPASQTKFLVGVTSCPTGIAHTFMAAEALLRAAKALGYEMKVETRGSVGAKNELTEEEIARADAVVVAADATVETTRFAGKRLLETGTKAAIKDGEGLIKEALALEAPTASSAKSGLKSPPRKSRTGAYKHLMTGVSHMLPLIVAGGLLIALSFAIGGVYAGDEEGTLGWALMQIGGASAFALFIPVLAGYIAYSIADRPGLTPGLIGGMLAVQIGSGFLGGLAAGFLAGYLALWLNRTIQLPDSLEGLKPVLILPLLSSLIVGLSMIYVIGPPVKVILETMSAWLGNMQEGSALTLGLILGGMMAFDMGGPVNKAAYTFSIGLLATEIYGPMAAVMAAGMVPPLACAIAANIARDRFTKEEREASKATAVLGISFITEGAIPYAAADPLRVIPCTVLGAAVTGAMSMYFGCELVVPHGGVFVLLIPNAINHVLPYLGAIVAGTAVSTLALCIVKRPVSTKSESVVGSPTAA
ncbi:PTS fructose transporter subunit IIC [Cerasicoccus arenae]|uniref:protein-N(pi)-phosphohistidine--D-fructose phosphotransferase n=1 Tax=Cerasicoccus arenae TaxID=424488 RepID=A0A8J3GDC7_9BACT|nr:fructose-specific PTS transporter subunit EIIC [Cerasicoccus arenae]MBK1858300.1 PTS fructose transporter subunit IIBC [Cerasicoccus arenae]GHB90623.1 PTS fructose transporter subunit IIBC [Cerasicoccus arenae]